MKKPFSDNEKILLFDGDCAFCNSSVLFVIKNNSKKNIIFLSLQSDNGKEILDYFDLASKKLDSLVFVENGNCYIKSRAALNLAKYLDGYYKMLPSLKIIPAFISDFFYDIVAKNRYLIMGKSKTECKVPNKEERARMR